MPVGRAEAGKHPEGALAPMRQDREPGDRQQADEQQPQGGEREHDRRRGGLVFRPASRDVEAGVAGQP